ncbi:hypothetical protein COO51_08240 [Yersinia enterocolitica]|nr:hypothetical protein COO51_08240 [Yersinia enterocolitica]
MMNRFIVFSPPPSSFKLQVCWLHSLTRITYLSKLIGIMSLIRGSPCGPAQALFKVVYNQFVSRLPPSYTLKSIGIN